MNAAIQKALKRLAADNPGVSLPAGKGTGPASSSAGILVAHRGEIARRLFFVLREEGIQSVAVVADSDRGQSWYEFADQVVYIGAVENYTNGPVIVAAALLAQARAVLPSRGGDIARTLNGEAPLLMGPPLDVVELAEDTARSRQLAVDCGLPVFSDYIRGRIREPLPMEVHIFNGTAVGITAHALQTHGHRLIIESGDYFLENRIILKLLADAETLAKASGFSRGAGIGSIEFLYDAREQEYGFTAIHAGLREEQPGIADLELARWQVLYFDGREGEIPCERALRRRFTPQPHAMECRVYARDPWNDFALSPGRIKELDLPTLPGVRCEFGYAVGDEISPRHSALIGKITAHGEDRSEALVRLERALGELYVGGVTTNIDQLLHITRHNVFRGGSYGGRLFIDAPELNRMESGCENPVQAAMFLCLTEFLRVLNETAEICFASDDLENVLQGEAIASMPRAFEVRVLSENYRVQLMQTSPRACRVFVNGACMGTARIRARGRDAGRYHILFRDRAYPVRVDRRAEFYSLRVLEEDGRMRYYRLELDALGTGRPKDPPGLLRCPFQGSFVSFASGDAGKPLSPGDVVSAGDPLVVIAAMKMETTLNAPVDGRIAFMLEDGDAEKLIQARTESGLVIGRGLSEGQELIRIESENVEQSAPRKVLKPRETAGLAGLLAREVSDERKHEDLIRREAPGHAAEALELLRSYCLGFLSGRLEEARLFTALNAVREAPAHLRDVVLEILDIYAHLKQIYSPVLGQNQTWFGEMNRVLRNWDDASYRPPYFFRSVMANLLTRYGIGDEGEGRRSRDKRIAFFHILRAYGALNGGARFLPPLLRLLKKMPGTPDLKSIRRLERRESAEQNHDIALEIRDLSRAWSGNSAREPSPVRVSALGDATAEPSRPMPAWAVARVEELHAQLTADHETRELEWSGNDVRLFRSVHRESGETRLDCITYLPAGRLDIRRGEDDEIIELPEVETAARRSAAAVNSLPSLNADEKLFVLVLAGNDVTVMEPGGDDPRVINRGNLGRFLGKSLKYYRGIPASLVLVELQAEFPGVPAQRRHLSVYIDAGQAAFDWIFPEDRRHPFWNGKGDERTRKLFQRRKWPVEIWARECFDAGTSREILIPSIDQVRDPRRESADGDPVYLPVGARIHHGFMRGSPAYFFMKDSRHKGGATGDLEGRKYVAAAYLAYMRDEPLYIWNDGAGANIREGMVALNRAGQGFMLNAMTAARMEYGDFLSRMSRVHDESLRRLLQELDELFCITPPEPSKRPVRYFLTAVGIGSSTGLDVYGSSQATLQVMLESRESYRVLTGAGVIKAVTGEDLTNYEIGGAPVMGRWTGTADIIAADKLDLIHRLRGMHELLSPSAGTKKFERQAAPAHAARAPDFVLLNERILRSAADDGEFTPLKKEYQEAGALLGGMVRLGGAAALVMGPRTDAGIRSFACAVKARELLRIADRLELPRILVFEHSWYRGDGESRDDLRARMDFMRTLNEGRGPRLHIIRGMAGLRRVSLNSGADVLIFIPRGDESAEDLDFARTTAALTAPHMPAAFALAARVLRLLRNVHTADNVADFAAGVNGRRTVTLPDTASQPFDMKKDVMEILFDPGSLLVFRPGGEGPAGEPNLVTALASLNGRTMGIIADQPLYGGAPDAPGTEKFRVFMEFLEKNRIPLLMISNAPGFVPGIKQERLRIQQIGGESLDVNVLSTVPVVSLILKQNFGGRMIHAFSKFLRPGVTAIALEEATLAVMGAQASFDLFKKAEFDQLLAEGRGREADELRESYLLEFNTKSRADRDAMRTGALDWTIPSADNLREQVQRAMRLAEQNRPKDA